ncbi:hypothetical protein N0B44_31915 [Roseibacterium beibuensis]|uniref:hypothetical protein n=1 Tax=[Roseibacterium] beibuensis TaxID=1193142 RepID=UPI00217EF614|nr:hypothetical protein [Roseibacterium beibuensis]MCS6627521.1 hypothetical protein [Roseibacterium beibuensis]
MIDETALLRTFEAGEIDPAAFSHRDHLRVGWAMLGPGGSPFHEAYVRYRRGLVELTRAAGAPEKFSETQTLGWLALIHEALESTGERAAFDAFERRSGLNGRSLSDRYPPGRLGSGPARLGLLLP